MIKPLFYGFVPGSHTPVISSIPTSNSFDTRRVDFFEDAPTSLESDSFYQQNRPETIPFSKIIGGGIDSNGKPSGRMKITTFYSLSNTPISSKQSKIDYETLLKRAAAIAKQNGVGAKVTTSVPGDTITFTPNNFSAQGVHLERNTSTEVTIAFVPPSKEGIKNAQAASRMLKTDLATALSPDALSKITSTGDNPFTVLSSIGTTSNPQSLAG